eukprot:8056024-Heterocapsa_arctica.AAC.1
MENKAPATRPQGYGDVFKLSGHNIDDSVADLNVYADANWVSGPSRHLTYGDCVLFCGTLLGIRSCTQPVVTFSAARASSWL